MQCSSGAWLFRVRVISLQPRLDEFYGAGEPRQRAFQRACGVGWVDALAREHAQGCGQCCVTRLHEICNPPQDSGIALRRNRQAMVEIPSREAAVVRIEAEIDL